MGEDFSNLLSGFSLSDDRRVGFGVVPPLLLVCVFGIPVAARPGLWSFVVVVFLESSERLPDKFTGILFATGCRWGFRWVSMTFCGCVLTVLRMVRVSGSRLLDLHCEVGTAPGNKNTGILFAAGGRWGLRCVLVPFAV